MRSASEQKEKRKKKPLTVKMVIIGEIRVKISRDNDTIIILCIGCAGATVVPGRGGETTVFPLETLRDNKNRS